MRKILTALAALLMASPAFAGAQFCNDDVPYYIEEIPHGFAVVRMNSADYCKITMDANGDFSERYICDGRNDYQLDFQINDDTLRLTFSDGSVSEFFRCEMEL